LQGLALVLGWGALPVGVTELDLGEGSATTGIVDNLLDDSTNVTGTLGEIEGAQLGGTLSQTSVRLEDSSRLTLSTNDTTHFSIRGTKRVVERIELALVLIALVSFVGSNPPLHLRLMEHYCR